MKDSICPVCNLEMDNSQELSICDSCGEEMHSEHIGNFNECPVCGKEHTADWSLTEEINQIESVKFI